MTDQARAAQLTGGCQCGAVRYALYAEPQSSDICHCRMCQKATGNLFMAAAGVPLADFAWTRGEPVWFQSSSLAERGFCARCGTPLAFRYVGRPKMTITIGSLDEPARVPPRDQIGVESRLPWLDEVLRLPGKTTAEDPPPGGADAVRSLQHPDHEPAPGRG
jgi:hypothetical protein